MFKKLISDAAMWQELSLLKEEVKALRNQQIKKDRDMEDLLYNLDSDNVPQLEGIVKRINLIVSGDGTAKAEFLIEAINGSSTVKIKADAIDLDGKVINLTTENVKIESENFSVDTEGNMECGNAKIRGNSTLCSDIVPGAENEVAMAFGPEIEFDVGEGKTVSGTKMRITDNEDALGGATYTRGVAFVSTIDRNRGAETHKTVHGGVVADPHRSGAFMTPENYQNTETPEYDQAFVGLERVGDRKNTVLAILRNRNVNYSLEGDEPEYIALWINDQGQICTNATQILFGENYE